MTTKLPDPEARLTRAELAKAVGRSKTTIRRWEEQGKLKPIIGPNGVRLYRVADAEQLNGGTPVDTLPRARPYAPKPAEGDGELAAQIFELLEQNVHPVAIVARLREHPDVVESFVDKWARMRRACVLSAEQVRTIKKFYSIKSFRDVDDLIEQLKSEVIRLTTCRHCTEGSQLEYCLACLQDAVERARISATEPQSGK